jgi:ADP-ribosylation factor-like protein 5B
MGYYLSKLWNKLRRDRECKIMLLGLANAGKTTILYKLHLGDVIIAYPTIGSNVEEIVHKNLRLQVWDLGGQESLRVSWHTYFISAEAVIFVLDSADTQNALLAKMELFNLLLDENLKGAPVLILANKCDLPVALSAEEISNLLCLTEIRNHDWHIQSCSAILGDGLQEGIEWLCDKINSRH